MFTTKRIVIAGGLVALIGAALLVFNNSGEMDPPIIFSSRLALSSVVIFPMY